MKAAFIVVCKVLNPLYDGAAERRALDARQDYDQTKEVEVEPGYVISGPDVWVHCCPGFGNTAPICKPADEECRAKVREWMEVTRPGKIQQIQNMLDNLDSIKNEAERKHIVQLAKDYGLTPGGDPSDAIDPTDNGDGDESTKGEDAGDDKTEPPAAKARRPRKTKAE